MTDDGTYYWAQINPSSGQYISFASPDATVVDCSNYDNALNASCATTVYSSQYDTDLATGNWLNASNGAGTATYTVTSTTSLASYINSLHPGDILELADGVWSNPIDLAFTANGTQSQPITIRAQHPGGVTFTNSTQLEFRGSWIRVEGFKFAGTYVHPDPANIVIALRMGRTGTSCSHCLFSNMDFESYNASDPTNRAFPVSSNGQWNKVASSTFKGKTDSGVEIVLATNNLTSGDMRDYLLITGNYFADRVDSGVNGYEGIRMGDSAISFLDSRSYIIGNLFKDYTGEAELISLKRNNVTIRGNTFINSGHTPVSARESEYSTIEGNIVDGMNVSSNGGFRLNGTGHTVVHNIFQNMDYGDGHISSYTPFVVYKGQFTGSGVDYRPVTNMLSGFNTVSNSRNAFYTSGSPSGVTVPVYPSGTYAYNILSGITEAAVTVDSSSTIAFSNNIYNGSNLGTSATGFDTVTNASVTNQNGVFYSSASALDYTIKPYRVLYADMGFSTTTLFKLEYVNASPEQTIPLTKLTSSYVGAQYDSTTPVISSVAASSTVTTRADISWTTDEVATSQAFYGLTTSYGTSSTLSTTTSTSHAVSLLGLSAATTYHYVVVSTDPLGNTATSSDATFTTAAAPDTTAPVLSSISSGTPGQTTATITWTTNESSNSRIDYGLTTSYGTASTSASLSTSHSITLTGLTAGTTYHFRVQSVDAASNTATSSDQTFTTAAPDTTAPVISAISSGTPGQTSATISWTTDEGATSRVAYGLTSSYDSYTTFDATLVTSHSQPLSSLTAATTYHYAVVSTDSSGNTATSSDQTFTTAAVPDTTAPVISAISSGTPGQTSTTVTWTTDENATSRVAYGLTSSYDSYTTLDATTVTSHSQLVSGLTSATTYHYAVVSTDSSGNTATSSDQTFTTAVIPDTTAPVISAISSDTPGQTTATITWTTDEASDSRVDYGASSSYGTASTSAALTTSHSITLSGLTSATTYHYAVVSTDSSGNTATSSDATFTTAVIPDITAPVISLISVATTTTSATITWTTDESADSRIDFGFFSAYGTESSSASLVTSHSITLSGLSSATTYHYRVQSTDGSSNVATSSDATFTTATAPDTTAPDISAISSDTPGQTSTRVTWTTDENATSQVAYGLTTSYDSYTTFDPILDTSHSQSLSSLTAATTYHYAVISTDASGNTATSSDQTFTTAAVPDTTSPIISSVSVSTTTTTATITWTTDESSDSRVDYGASSAYGTASTSATLGTSHSITLTGLSSATTYHYRVQSTDASSNTATSSDATFITATVPDTTAPVLSSISAGTPGQTSTTITWTSDENATTRIAYGPTSSYGSYTSLNASLVTSHSQAVSGLTAATTYHYAVISADASGNTATSSDQTFVTSSVPDTTAPVISSISAGTPGQTSTTITWTTNESSDSRVDYGASSSYGAASTSASLGTSHSLTLIGLTAATTYHYRIQSTDASSNTATSSDQTFTTAAPDTTAPVISAISSGTPGQTSATVSWTTDESATSRVAYGLTTSYDSYTTLDATLATSHSQSLSSLSSGTTYHYVVVSTDASGNVATSSDQTFATSAVSSGGGGGGGGGGGSSGGGGGGSTVTLPTSTTGTTVGTITATTPTTSNTPLTPVLKFSRPLAAGSRGMDVSFIQSKLAQDKTIYPEGKITGFYGALTAAAVLRFQTRYGILTAANASIVDATTFALISSTVILPPVSLPVSSSVSMPGVNLTLGSKGDSVVSLQNILIRAQKGPAAAALSVYGATGYFGAATQAALAEFQRAVGITPAAGYFGPKTQAYLQTAGI